MHQAAQLSELKKLFDFYFAQLDSQRHNPHPSKSDYNWVQRASKLVQQRTNNLAPDYKLTKKIQELCGFANSTFGTIKLLLTDRELETQQAEIDMLATNFNTWSSPKKIISIANTYQSQYDLLTFFDRLIDLSSELKEVRTLIVNKELENRTINSEIKSNFLRLQQQTSKSMDALFKQLNVRKANVFLNSIRDDSYNDRADTLKVVVEGRRKRLNNLHQKLKIICLKSDARTISFLRLLSDKSGIESASIGLCLVAALGAAAKVPYYSVFGFEVLNYWVVEDYFDAGIFPAFIVFPVIFIAGKILNNACLARLRQVAQNELCSPQENEKSSFVSFITRFDPSSTLIAFTLLCLVLTSGWGYLSAKLFTTPSFNEFAITNQNHELNTLFAVGSSSRATFILSCAGRSQECTVVNSKRMVLDRAQILCHSLDNTCIEVIDIKGHRPN